jgi:hypothetical protein
VQVLTISEQSRETKSRLARLARYLLQLEAGAWCFVALTGGALFVLYWRERLQRLGLLHAAGFGKGAIILCAGCQALVVSLAGMVTGSMVALLTVRLVSTRIAAVVELPLLPDGISQAVSGIPWLWLAFAGAMAGESAIIVLGLLRRDPADLLRAA